MLCPRKSVSVLRERYWLRETSMPPKYHFTTALPILCCYSTDITNEVAIHTAGLVYSNFGATDRMAGHIHMRTYFAYTHGSPCGQWYQNACTHGWRWLQFIPADHTAVCVYWVTTKLWLIICQIFARDKGVALLWGSGFYQFSYYENTMYTN